MHKIVYPNQCDQKPKTFIHPLPTVREARVFGIRTSRTFEQAAAKFVAKNLHNVPETALVQIDSKPEAGYSNHVSFFADQSPTAYSWIQSITQSVTKVIYGQHG